MPLEIVIYSKKIPNIETLFSLFEARLGKKFGRTLDGLRDALTAEGNVRIVLLDKVAFEAHFGEEATKDFFADGYSTGMSSLSEILLSIFQETSTLEFEIAG